MSLIKTNDKNKIKNSNRRHSNTSTSSRVSIISNSSRRTSIGSHKIKKSQTVANIINDTEDLITENDEITLLKNDLTIIIKK